MSVYRPQIKTAQSGFLVILLLVYGSVFFILLASFMVSIMTQWQVMRQNIALEQSLHIAEAGLEYYKWFLAHYPGDITHGTGEPGPYVLPFADPEGDVVGEFSLDVSGVEMCGEVGMIDITSTGRVVGSDMERTVYGRYARPSIAEYSFIINSNVWAGFNLDITGPYHSNGLIRMSGLNHSIVTSQQDSWECDDSQLTCVGANDGGTTVSAGDTIGGIYGEGAGRALWSHPVPPIDFTTLLVNLADMEDKAESAGGILLPGSGASGYRVHFNGDGTVTVRRVTNTRSHDEFSTEVGDWYTAQNIVRTVGPAVTYTIPTDCPVFFVQDKVWLSGSVSQMVTFAAADPTNVSFRPSIIIQDNITYTSPDAGLLVIAEEDVLLGVDVPNNLELNGIYVAQNGKFGRNHYSTLPSGYAGYRLRDSITINGTVVSNGRVGTQWVNASGNTLSGFLDRTNTYDRDLVEDPPALTPRTSDTYRFIEWREIRNR